jgi:hypothetical protein
MNQNYQINPVQNIQNPTELNQGYYNPLQNNIMYNNPYNNQGMGNGHISNVHIYPNNQFGHNPISDGRLKFNFKTSDALIHTQSREEFWNKKDNDDKKFALQKLVNGDIQNNKEKQFNHLLTFTNKKGEVLTRSAIKFRPEKKETTTNYFNSIDSYLFRDALYKLEEIKDKPQSEEKKQINESILERICKRYLNENELKYQIPAFEEWYENKKCYDIIISAGGEDLQAHKIVLISQSTVFKEMIEKNDNKIPNEIIKIMLPDSFKQNVVKDVLKWIYSNKISDKHDIMHYREILIIADNLKIYPLQKILIVKHILPNMSKEASIRFLKDSYNKKSYPENKDVWNLLATFSLNILSKNSSILIKNNRNEFLGMDLDLLFKCVEQSVFYLMEDIHLINLIKLIIDRGFAVDIFDLINKISKPYTNARNFHCQNIDLTLLIKELDPLKPIELAYITDESNDSLLIQNIENVTNNIELNKNKIDIIDVKKCNSPATNYVQNVDIKKNKIPTYSFSFHLNNDQLSNCTIISESFNTNSRSWVLKFDITENGDVSIYLVERGVPFILDNNQQVSQPYLDKHALKYNSILFEFEVKDVSFEKSGVIFFSFISGQHQIIGYDNFFNIKQLGQKNSCNFNVYLKEFPLHAACLQHITDNFQKLVNGAKKTKDDKNDKMTEKNIFDMLACDLTYILFSDALRVDNENNVFTTAYRYCLQKTPQDIEMLMNAIRYKFVDLKLLCTTARDHDTLKNSHYFKKHFQKELERRLKPIDITYHDKGEIRCFGYHSHRPRKYYDNKDDKNKPFNITNDLVSFFLENEHHSGYIKEIERVIILLI